jgi:uncharacterized protein YbcC (UPF0753/DUF2309 family)
MKMALINTSNERHLDENKIEKGILLKSMRKACKKIAPLWPLENFVAVNPYLGHTAEKFENVAQELAAAGGIQMTLPIAFYLQKLKEGKLREKDLDTCLRKHDWDSDVSDFINNLENTIDAEESNSISTFADIASLSDAKDWNRFMTGRISVWAASYFDKGQASWSAANKNLSPFAAWKQEASIDRSPELNGLQGFRNFVKALPDDPYAATQIALDRLGLPRKALSLYLHRVLLRLGGWSAYAARLDWDNELYGGEDGKLLEFLAVLVCWEAALLQSLNSPELSARWQEAIKVLSEADLQKNINLQLQSKLILQEAYDLSAQQNIVLKFQEHKAEKKNNQRQAKAQAIFCIDVRSEVYRRNLELVDNDIETLGFAGFFAFPIKYVPLGHADGEAQCPVLLTTGPTIKESLASADENEKALEHRLLHRQIRQVWKTFKSGAISNFSFVSPMGLSYLPKLFTDSFGLTRPVANPNDVGMKKARIKKKSISLTSESWQNETAGIPLEQQISMAKNALNAMSLTENFAQFVLIVGHGSSMVNNPHATGYDCGACGGHTGEANARVAAAVLNNSAVRTALQKEAIHIPNNTVFLACLHDTTTDEVLIYNENDVLSSSEKALDELKQSLLLAGKSARTERSLRLNSDSSNTDKAILGRSKDWSQIRPEWGLAGCSAFVVAPRERTKGINLEGKSFLHSYNWKKDAGFSVLELIMTAPMVVTSWINLQYYGSAVDNKQYGSGNKTLHNVTAGLGVLEGYSGDLRVGLPFQAVHDGDQYQHEPQRLQVVIEAPIEAMNDILEKHQSVRDLCDNGWIYLLAMDANGQVSHRYTGDLKWEKIKALAA